MILSGEKMEEYREIKPYWNSRLIEPHISEDGDFEPHFVEFKHFDTIRFTNGYSKNAPSFEIECLGISISKGKIEWGATTVPHPFDTEIQDTFIIQLGKITSTKNIPQCPPTK